MAAAKALERPTLFNPSNVDDPLSVSITFGDDRITPVNAREMNGPIQKAQPHPTRRVGLSPIK